MREQRRGILLQALRMRPETKATPVKACGHENDVEARFCESCGAPLKEGNDEPSPSPALITPKAKEERALQTKRKAIEISSIVFSVLGICYFALSVFLIFGSYLQTDFIEGTFVYKTEKSSLFDYLISILDANFFSGGTSAYAPAIGDILNSTMRPIVFVIAFLGIAALIAFAVFGIVSIAKGLRKKTVPNAKTSLFLSLLTVISVSSLLLSTTASISSSGESLARHMGGAPISLIAIGCLLLVFELVLEAIRDYEKNATPADIAITVLQSVVPFFLLFLIVSFGGKYVLAVIPLGSSIIRGNEGFLAYYTDILNYLANNDGLTVAKINQVIGTASAFLALNLVIAFASIGMAPWLFHVTRKKNASAFLIIIPSIYFVLSIFFAACLPIENAAIRDISFTAGESLKVYMTGAGPICFILLSLLLLGLGIALFVILQQKGKNRAISKN